MDNWQRISKPLGDVLSAFLLQERLNLIQFVGTLRSAKNFVMTPTRDTPGISPPLNRSRMFVPEGASELGKTAKRRDK